MAADILIIGQGLAGTLLGWECERAGIPFEIVDAGPAGSASRVAAGIVNPITGRRWVKSAGVETLLPVARAAYREMEAVLGSRLWRDLRVRRLFADPEERARFDAKRDRGASTPYLGEADADGFWIEGAGWVDLTRLLDGMRRRWNRIGCWRAGRVDLQVEMARRELTIDASGMGISGFDFVPWEFSKGEILTLAVTGLDPGVVLNRGHWILPIAAGVARAGATHEPGCRDTSLTAAGRSALEASVGELIARPWVVTRHEAGVRVSVPDRRPVAGRHPRNPRWGIINGLGGKGVLWAPGLARQWVNHLTEGVPFEAEIDVARFDRIGSSQSPA